MSERVRNRRTETLSSGWGTLTRHAFERQGEDGSWNEQTREIYDHGHAVACLAHDPVQGTVLLVRQFRLPVMLHEGDIEGGTAHDGMSVETPAGLIDAGESPEETMRREMLEETGYEVSDLTFVADLYASPGSLSERMVLFTATYRSGEKAAEGGGLAEEGEEIEVLELPLTEARAMLADGRIRDLKTAFLIARAS